MKFSRTEDALVVLGSHVGDVGPHLSLYFVNLCCLFGLSGAVDRTFVGVPPEGRRFLGASWRLPLEGVLV